MDKVKALLALLPALFTCCGHAAVPSSGGTRVEFSGTVVAPPACTLNNNQVIEVQFGNVGISKADGKQIVKTLDYNLKCSGADASKALKMRLYGTAGFDGSVLATSTEDLAIRFYRNGEPVIPGEWFTLPNPANSLVLTASPVSRPGSTPVEGSFQASATLMVTFQ